MFDTLTLGSNFLQKAVYKNHFHSLVCSTGLFLWNLFSGRTDGRSPHHRPTAKTWCWPSVIHSSFVDLLLWGIRSMIFFSIILHMCLLWRREKMDEYFTKVLR